MLLLWNLVWNQFGPPLPPREPLLLRAQVPPHQPAPPANLVWNLKLLESGKLLWNLKLLESGKLLWNLVRKLLLLLVVV